MPADPRMAPAHRRRRNGRRYRGLRRARISHLPPVRVSPKPQRGGTLRMGRSLDRLQDIRGRPAAEVEREDEPSLAQIMDAIQGCQTKLIDHFEGLKMEFSFLKHDMQKLREKAQVTDRCIASLDDIVMPLDTAAQVTKKTLSEYTLKMADMEDRMRRNNIRLVGFPEGAEGRRRISRELAD